MNNIRYRLNRILFPITFLFFFLFMALASYAQTNDPTIPATPSAPSGGLNLLIGIIPLLVPIIILAVKKVIPVLPTWTLPIIAPALGALIDWITTLTGHAGTGTITAALLGSAGVGVREILDQVTGSISNGAKTVAQNAAAILILFVGLSMFVGCGADKLQNGGAYSPGANLVSIDASGATVTNFVPTGAPDFPFFAVDSAFDFGYSTIDAAFSFERNNRAMLWKVSPDIKHSLDAIRPQAAQIVTAYSKARAAYIANPTPAGLSTLQNALTEIQRLAVAASAAVPTNAPAK